MLTKKRVVLTVAWVASTCVASCLVTRWAFQAAMDEALRKSEALLADLERR